MNDNFLPIRTFRLKHFKAVRDSGDVRFTPLTVFIGNNGSGKSSLIEGLQAFQEIVTQGLDTAMQRWRGFEYIHNPPLEIRPRNGHRAIRTPEISFMLKGDASEDGLYRAHMKIGMSSEGEHLAITEERVNFRNRRFLHRNAQGYIHLADIKEEYPSRLREGTSSLMPLVANNILNQFYYDEVASFVDGLEFSSLSDAIARWQFVLLDPYAMGHPRPQRRTSSVTTLERDGSNIAEYLLDIRQEDPDAFDGIIEAIQYVLPFARDLQANLTSELERLIYLQLNEAEYRIPGWLLSSGTLRILALLALFRHPRRAPLIVIEEIENGLDPRTLHLVVEELRNLVEGGSTQVIITTHSPYLLDLLALSQIVLVERINGQPTFIRPADQQALDTWAKEFGPGRLYTMNKLSQQVR